MKNLDKKLLAIIVILIIIVICLTIMLISNQKGVLTFKTQIIKEMSESTQLTDLQTQINTLNASHEEYAKNVQAYKTKIAEAITNQEVPTSADAKTEIIVENIGKILQAKTTATATAAQILSGQTAWVNGSKITGTMVDRGAVTKTLNAGGSYTIPAGYHNGSGKVTANSLASQTQATATADNITAGKTAYVNGKLITGNGADIKASYPSPYTLNLTKSNWYRTSDNVYTTYSDIIGLDISNYNSCTCVSGLRMDIYCYNDDGTNSGTISISNGTKTIDISKYSKMDIARFTTIPSSTSTVTINYSITFN